MRQLECMIEASSKIHAAKVLEAESWHGYMEYSLRVTHLPKQLSCFSVSEASCEGSMTNKNHQLKVAAVKAWQSISTEDTHYFGCIFSYSKKRACERERKKIQENQQTTKS